MCLLCHVLAWIKVLFTKDSRDASFDSKASCAHLCHGLFSLHDSMLVNNHLETDGCSDKSEREAHDESDNGANENGERLSEESDMDQSDDLSPALKATSYVEQSQEDIAEVVWLTFST